MDALSLWRLYERFPGALPSALRREDIGDLTRPFAAGSVYQMVQAVNSGNGDSLSAEARKIVEPLIKQVRALDKQQQAAALKAAREARKG